MVPSFAESLQRMLIEVAGSRQVSLLLCDIALLIDRPGSPAAIPDFLKNDRCLAQRRLRTRIIAQNLRDIREVMQATRRCQPIG